MSLLATGALHFVHSVPKLHHFIRYVSRPCNAILVNGRLFYCTTKCGHNSNFFKKKQSNGETQHSKSMITILHFNDIYNVEAHSYDPVGGAARFTLAMKKFHYLEPLVFFSGDAFSPSMLSTFTKGEQMVSILNDVSTSCAVFGNHDFDHGLMILSQLVENCTFPWLMSNVIDNETGEQLGNGKTYCVFERNNKKIGVIGLVEREWLETLPTIDPEELTFLNFVEIGQKLSAELKQNGCDFVIALTHMRMLNDIQLAESDNDIDLILGGHDHVYETHEVNGKFIVKSGSDFRQFSKILINTSDQKKFKVEQIDEISILKSMDEDPETIAKLDKFFGLIDSKMNDVLGYFSVPLDGRFSIVRSEESNLGNWICDVILSATRADLVILNSGTLRSDRVHNPGPFTMRDLINVVPLRDPLIVLRVSGQQILQALENAVSKYPKLEGRFPQVSGISFAFDPRKKPGQRVDPGFIRVGDDPLQMNQYYNLATKSYIHGGCDGYVMLKNVPIVLDGDECPELGLAVQNHFQSINIFMGHINNKTKHRQSLVTVSRRHSYLISGCDLPTRNQSFSEYSTPRPFNITEMELKSCQLAPKIENRIIRIDNDAIYEDLIRKLKNDE